MANFEKARLGGVRGTARARFREPDGRLDGVFIATSPDADRLMAVTYPVVFEGVAYGRTDGAPARFRVVVPVDITRIELPASFHFAAIGRPSVLERL